MAEDMDLEALYAEMLRQIKQDYEDSGFAIVSPQVEWSEIMLPMTDGIRLMTYICQPQMVSERDTDKIPVIIQRSPYVHSLDIYRIHGENLAKRGFGYVLQICRGCGESEGNWEPNVNERKDGSDTLHWLAECPWADCIGYWGDSYLALTGWCVADILPEKVRGMYLGVYGTDRFISAYEKGLFRMDVLTSWAMENAGFPITADYLESCRYRPQLAVDEKLWGRKLPWYREWITATKADDTYWQEGFWKMLKDIPSKVSVPIYLTEGWYDHHLGSALRTWENLSEQAKEMSTLSIGSWNHYSRNCLEWNSPCNLQNSEIQSMLDWFGQILCRKEIPKKNIRIYLIGKDTWMNLNKWPPTAERVRKYYLSQTAFACPDRKVSDAPEGIVNTYTLAEGNMADEKNVFSFTYDPEEPVMSYGGEAMLYSIEKVGSLYQPLPGWRKDVLSFISEPLMQDILTVGRIHVKLHVASDCQDTAFTAKVMEIFADGKAVNIRSSITTIAADREGMEPYIPGEITEVEINMWDIAWQFSKGSRIRLDISSSDFPQYAVHSNYADIWSKQEYTRIAEQKIVNTSIHPSFLELPILES